MTEKQPLTFRGVRIPGYNLGTAWASETAQQWRNGVLAALDSLDVGEGKARPEVQAFTAVLDEDTGTARQIIRQMSPRDRAVLQYVLRTVSRIAEEEDGFAENEDRRRAREDILAFE